MFGAIGQRVERSAQNMNDMMARVDLDPETAPELGAAFASAVHRCLWCSSSVECRQWLDAGGTADAGAPAFCPNAAFFARSIGARKGAGTPAARARTASEEPDAALLAVCREWDEAAAEHDASTLALDAAEARLEDIDPPAPEALFEKPNDRALGLPPARCHGGGRRWYGPVATTLRGQLRQRARPILPEARARILEILAAYDAWHAAREEAEEISGVRLAAAWDRAAGERVDALLKRIVAMPATTLEGLRRKAAAAAWSAGGIGQLEAGLRELDQVDVALTMSIVRDLLALAPQEK